MGGWRLRISIPQNRRSRLARFRSGAAVSLLFLASLPGHAAPFSDPQSHTAEIRHIAAKIRVDGRLDESVWGQITPITEFVQTNPDEGAPASERTEAFLFYDDEKIYFGFKCYDSEPGTMVARYDTHDARTNSDSVNILLDPYGDRRTAYFFSINARGVQFDALLSEGNAMDPTWDGIWESAARLYDWGWEAEVAVPFKSIRFHPGQTWGLNLGRDIVRKNENDNWQMVTRFDGFMRPSKAGYLAGIENIRPGRNIELIPYFAARVRRGAFDPLDNRQKYEGGGDVRWGLRPNLTLNAAINPDFADTEADEINITISRFELFFPEKRSFFTEGSNFFATPFQLFFTRRIGARLTDQNGLTNGEPQRIFFVLRIAHDIGKNSAIGFITINRDQQPGDVGSTERVHAADLNLVLGPHWKWQTQAGYNQNRVTTSGGIQRGSFGSQAQYNSEKWQLSTFYKFLGRGFDVSQIGFEPETDRHSGGLDTV